MDWIRIHTLRRLHPLGSLVFLLSVVGLLAFQTVYWLHAQSFSEKLAAREDSRSTSPTIGQPVKQQVLEAYGKLPLSFEANQGQIDGQVKFLSRGSGYTLSLTSTEAILALRKPNTATPRTERSLVTDSQDSVEPRSGDHAIVRMKLVGSSSQVRVEGLDELPGTSNYFIGKDPKKWRTNVPTYAKVHYQSIYPGIDLVYYGNQRQLEYDFVVAPGADPGTIRLAFEGVDKLEVDDRGDLILHTGTSHIEQRKPLIYQEVEGSKQEIAGGYVLQGERQVGFRVDSFDRDRPLIIDPVLVYSTYLGGGNSEVGLGIAVDATGSAYVTGDTSGLFPTTSGAFDTSFNAGSVDVFVTKLDANGSALVYSTYLGGGGVDEGLGIAVDATDSAYVTGHTFSANFPTTLGAFDTAYNGTSFSNGDVFVTQLNAAGLLLYSTYLGGNGSERGSGIVVDVGGAYVTGVTNSANFPTTSGAFDISINGTSDNVFVTKLNAIGSALVYSTYLGGGTGTHQSGGIAVDAGGSAYVTGGTNSIDFPTTPGAFDTTLTGNFNAFVTKLYADGSDLVYSTYLGGTPNGDGGRGIAVDAGGSAYVTGVVGSGGGFPTTPSAFQTTGSGCFVTKFNPAGTALAYSTLINNANCVGIAVDVSGNAYVTGSTSSSVFPTTPETLDDTYNGNTDGFVTKLNATGSALAYSTYLGGSDNDGAHGIAVDTTGSAYVTGQTQSPNFPTTSGAFDTTFNGGVGATDAFVAKIEAPAADLGVSKNDSPDPVLVGQDLTYTIAVSNDGPSTATGVTLNDTLPGGVTFVSASSNQGSCTQASGTVTCSLGSLANGASATVTLVIRPNSAGTIVNSATATANETDPVPSNNTATQSTTVSPGSLMTSLGPARIWIGLTNSDDVGIRFDLRAEVYRNQTQLVGSGELASVPGGSSGFNNAQLRSIDLTASPGVVFSSGDTLHIALYARNACSGSGKNSGRARLWYNDAAANSHFNATIGSPATYYLLNGFLLGTTPGTGPKKTIDVQAGAKCSPYKPFGTWTQTMQ